MKLGGWIFLIISWSSIIILTVFCFIKVLKEPEKDL
jgi:hypothetical protein